MVVLVMSVLLGGSRIVISEVMANPRGITGVHMPEDRNELVELYNPTDTAIDLAGWTISDGDAVDVLTSWTDSSLLAIDPSLVIGSSQLNPGSYAVVLDPEYTDTAATGGFVIPYRFGPGTLIVTVGNTTIGDGLTTNDPLFLWSESGDTTTFGTPTDTTDSIPCDAGDGISWERINLLGPDEVSNWIGCRDTAGCTPGGANSSTEFLDLAVTSISLADSATPRPGKPIAAAVGVSNVGFTPADNWSLSVLLDRNGNVRPDAGEFDTTLAGRSLQPGKAETLTVRLTCPTVTSDLCARLLNSDGDSTNNLMRLAIVPGGNERMFDLNLSSFSPDGDGFEDSLAVFYRLPEANGTLKVLVFDLAGRQVAVLFSGKAQATRGAACWNGLSSSGTRAPTGVYAICAEYRSSGAARTEKMPVVLLRK